MGKQKKQRVEGEHSKRHNMTWKEEMDETLLDAFIQEQEKGNRVDGTWTTRAYSNIVKLCSEKFGFPINKDHVKNRLRTLKANFGVCHDLFHGSSGFGWNHETRLFEAEPEVWKDRIEANREIGKWRHTPISHYDKMEMLFAKDRANRKGVANVEERNRQWAMEENANHVDHSPSGVDSSFPSLETLLSNNTPIQSDTARDVKRKAPMMDLLAKQIEVINNGLSGVVDALREGNSIAEKGIKLAERQIAITERSRLKVYNEEEVYVALDQIGVPKNLIVDAIIYLLKNPIDLRTFFAIPSDLRLKLLYKLMNI